MNTHFDTLTTYPLSLCHFLVNDDLWCTLLCHHDVFCELYQMNWQEFDLQRSHSVGSSRSICLNAWESFPWIMALCIINLFKASQSHRGEHRAEFCGFAFIVSLDKQEGEFSLSMTQWHVSCFFSSIFFFCVNELEIVRRGQEGRKRQSLLVKSR